MNELDQFIESERPELIKAIRQVLENVVPSPVDLHVVTNVIAELIRIDDCRRNNE
jgi:hypothetical protein